jgi:hypothetical protein
MRKVISWVIAFINVVEIYNGVAGERKLCI